MIFKTMDGISFPLTPDEEEGVKREMMAGKSHIAIRGALIPRSGIYLYPDAMWGQKSGQGRLHDGGRVVLRFGQWTMEHDPKVQISAEYYPEIRKDEVMTEAEWNEWQMDNFIGDERATRYALAMEYRKTGNKNTLLELKEQAGRLKLQ